MPFTLAHAAAALPMRKTRLVWSALVIGTMAPDLEYFLRMVPDDRFGHTLTGSILLSLPLGLITLWLFHKFVKEPVLLILPDSIRSRLTRREFRFGGVSRFLTIVFSMLIGMSTHLLWDCFTHRGTLLTRNWPILHADVALGVLGATVPVYSVLQHVSTVIGMVALAVAFVATIAVLSGAIAALGATIHAFAVVGSPPNAEPTRFAGVWVVTSIALFWWQIVGYGLWKSKARAFQRAE